MASLIRGATRKFLSFVTGIYFERIEVRGIRNLPRRPCIFAGNHPSGLVDALVIMTALPKTQLSTVGKETLFHMPLIGQFLHIMRAVPVARVSDGNVTANERQKINDQLFNTVKSRILDEEVSICIFPEGTCHSSTEMKELKTGTARMALEVAARDYASAVSSQQHEQTGGAMDESTTDGLNNTTDATSSAFPIVPIGLTYSDASGEKFRGSVLVDIGKPIYITPELLEMHLEGGIEGSKEACSKITNEIDEHLRSVTISVPNWSHELQEYCERNQLSDPFFRRRDKLKNKVVTMECVVDKDVFESDPLEIKKIVGKKLMMESANAGSQKQMKKLLEPHLQAQIRQSARRAFFGLSNAQGYTTFGDSDEIFVRLLHLARRVYKPVDIQLSLAQYAALTRNFMKGYLRTNALQDPEFAKLWSMTYEYAQNLELLKITDRSISQIEKQYNAHKISAPTSHDTNTTDDDTAARRHLGTREGRMQRLYKNLMDLAIFPLATFGTFVHLPFTKLVNYIGNRFGTHPLPPIHTVASSNENSPAPRSFDDELLSLPTHDRSVLATAKVVSSAVILSIYYPFLSYTTSTFLYPVTAYSFALTFPLGIGFFGLTGYLAAKEQRKLTEVWNTLSQIRDKESYQNALHKLLIQRQNLAKFTRKLADKHSPVHMKKWWSNIQKPRKAIVTAQQLQKFEKYQLQSLTIPLSKETKRIPQERAVLSFVQKGFSNNTKKQNRKALLWIGGRNDSFYHLHILDRLLDDAACDLYILDLRRCGRARETFNGENAVHGGQLFAHDSNDFSEYSEEIGEALAFIRDERSWLDTMDSSSALPSSTSSSSIEKKKEIILEKSHERNFGCGRKYDAVFGYGHSTGALAILQHGVDYPNQSFDGYIFNSPFWKWNLPWYEAIVTRYGSLFPSALRTIGIETTDDAMLNDEMKKGLDHNAEPNLTRVISEEKSDSEKMSSSESTSHFSDDDGIVSPSSAGNNQSSSEMILSRGGDVAEFSAFLHEIYNFPDILKSNINSHVTLGWCSAVSKVQERLRRGELVVDDKPLLCLYTEADTVLSASDIDQASDFLTTEKYDGKIKPMDFDGLVEREIGTDTVEPSCHDVLAAPSERRVKQAMDMIVEWLSHR
eukprot:g3629.t1